MKVELSIDKQLPTQHVFLAIILIKKLSSVSSLSFYFNSLFFTKKKKEKNYFRT